MSFIRQWRAALKVAGLALGLLPYDLRHSALRNMVRGGTDFTVAMRLSGHKTRSTFDRYNIVSEDDLRAAITRTEVYVESRCRRRGTSRRCRRPATNTEKTRTAGRFVT